MKRAERCSIEERRKQRSAGGGKATRSQQGQTIVWRKLDQTAINLRIMHNPAVILPDAFGRPGRARRVHEPGARLRRDCRKIRACRRCDRVIVDWQDRQLFGGK